MDCLTEVYNKIVSAGIELFSTDIPCGDATTINYNNTYGIFIDYKKFDSWKDEFCALIHEFGHCKTGTTHQLCSPFQLIEQHEYKANCAAVFETLPFDTLQNAVCAGYTEPWQLAEYFNLPEEFIHTAYDIYKRQGKI